MYAGSISEYDNCLAGTDAVIGIEVYVNVHFFKNEISLLFKCRT